MKTANEIRQDFINFFVKQHGHTFVPSSSVVPLDDPTLLFTNAGMNQFKDVFLGTGTRPYRRAANTQKCIRAGGKHNDLDDVGKDTYHHTFFEMLGNWSFGDYFKKEAIGWAWDLLTHVWGMDKSRLHATVFEGVPGVPRDDEAYELRRTVTDMDPANIHWGSAKDNFWEMGDTGPCGPCTEIHIDRTTDRSGGPLVNKGTPDVIEIWNLVFIQYNRNVDRSLSPLPARHVDTGMGFERVTAVLQGKNSNYDTDIFSPLFSAIHQTTGAAPYAGKLDDLRDTAYRVVADHIRTLTIALTDGAIPGNLGRGHALRRIDGAERYGRQHLGTKGPFLVELVPAVVEAMGEAFPELKKQPAKVQAIIRDEEESFLHTLDRGMKIFEEAVKRSSSRTISGDDAFRLHDTYGVYIDITEQMASERGLQVDRTGFERLMDQAKENARRAQKKIVITAVQGELPPTDDSAKFRAEPVEATVLGWIDGNTVVRQGQLRPGAIVALLLDRSNCYAEQGGQVGDFGGVIASPSGSFELQDTQRLGDTVLHIGTVQEGVIEAGQKARVTLNRSVRADTMRNHTATHLLNWALRKVLGEHIEQKGSLVDAEKTRFDFAHDLPLTAEQAREVERLVNERIYADLPVKPVTLPLAEAKRIPGVRAVFGEKYPDPVRVLLIGAEKPEDVTIDDPVEFCGGTHLQHTGQAGFFKIIGQEAVGKGVRRVTAVTGRRAVETVQQVTSVLEELAARFSCKPGDLPGRIEALEKECKALQQQLKKGVAGDLQGAADKLFAGATVSSGSKIIIGQMPTGPIEQIRSQIDRLRQKAGSAVVLVGWQEEDKVQLLASVTDDLVKKGLNAGKLIGQVARVVGGGGGGKPQMAQAGGKEPAKLPEALDMARKLVAEQIQAAVSA